MARQSSGESTASVIVLIIVISFLASCDSMKESPQVIEADGQTYVACHDYVWINNEGGGLLGGGDTTFRIKYTDSGGLSHVVKGIKKLSVSELPKTVPAPFPYPTPDPQLGTDKDGNHYKEGSTYTWPNGSQAVLRNGEWKRVMVPNTACKPE
jgi:hypothetical protein